MKRISEIMPEWEIKELIGTGSFGKVYRAQKEVMGHISESAIKVIKIPQEQSEVNELLATGMDSQSIQVYYEDLIRDLMNEIRIMESLKSADNVVYIEDYQVIENEGEIGWTIYIRMEFLMSLSAYMKERNLSTKEVLQIGKDICKALSYCEESHIIHRDVKVENVFINKNGVFKLGDFGISKQMEKTNSAMSQKGTDMYMAPEVFKGERYGSNVDIYSLGIMLYRLLNNNRFPFTPSPPNPLSYGDNEKANIHRIQGDKMTAPANASFELSRIICKACAHSPQERYQTAKEFGAMLEKYENEAEGLHIPLVRPQSSLDDGVKEVVEDGKTMSAFRSMDKQVEPLKEVKEKIQNKEEEDEKSVIGINDLPQKIPDMSGKVNKKYRAITCIFVVLVIVILVIFKVKNDSKINDKESKITPRIENKTQISYVLSENVVEFFNFGVKIQAPQNWKVDDEYQGVTLNSKNATISITSETINWNYSESKQLGMTVQPSASRIQEIENLYKGDTDSTLVSINSKKIENIWCVIVDYMYDEKEYLKYYVSNGCEDFVISGTTSNGISGEFTNFMEKILRSMEITRKSVKGNIVDEKNNVVNADWLSRDGVTYIYISL